MKYNSILYKILISFSCLIVCLLLCRNCSYKKQLNEQKQTIIKIDSILNLPPDTTIIRDTFFTTKRDTIYKEVSGKNVYFDTIITADIEIFIIDSLQTDSTLKRNLNYNLLLPTITEHQTEYIKVPVIEKQTQKRWFAGAGVGSNTKFTIPIATAQFGYTFDRFILSTNYIYNKDHNVTVNFAVRF